MKKQLMESLNHSIDRIKAVKHKMEKQSESLGDKSEELWDQTRDKLEEIQQHLESASKKLATNTDEAALQAHLAAMEAHSKWKLLHHNIETIARHANSSIKTEIDNTVLQANLAKMEASDFMATTGSVLKKEFITSKQQVEKSTMAAVDELKGFFDKLTK